MKIFSSEITLQVDKFKKTTWVYSAEIPNDNVEGRGCDNRITDCLDARFRSFYSKNNKLIFTQIYFVASIPDWMFFNSAVLDDGTDLRFREIYRRVFTGDSLQETFAVDLNSNLFEKMKKRVYKVSIRGKFGDWVLKIPIEIVTTFDDFTKNKFPQ